MLGRMFALDARHLHSQGYTVPMIGMLQQKDMCHVTVTHVSSADKHAQHRKALLSRLEEHF
jgi:hypothetical protein